MITKACQLLQSQESDTHSSIAMCLMMYVWATHPDSQKGAVALQAIQDYVLAETHDVDALIVASEEGKSINLHANWFSDDMQLLPGCKRLDYSMSFATFTGNWEHAVLLTVNRLTLW